MFEVSIEKQKIIMFIPFINICTPLLWLNNCHYWSYSNSTRIKGFFYSALYAVVVVLVTSALSQIFPSLSDILGYLTMYLGPLAMGIGLVRVQEKKRTERLASDKGNS